MTSKDYFCMLTRQRSHHTGPVEESEEMLLRSFFFFIQTFASVTPVSLCVYAQAGLRTQICLNVFLGSFEGPMLSVMTRWADKDSTQNTECPHADQHTFLTYQIHKPDNPGHRPVCVCVCVCTSGMLHCCVMLCWYCNHMTLCFSGYVFICLKYQWT